MLGGGIPGEGTSHFIPAPEEHVLSRGGARAGGMSPGLGSLTKAQTPF